MNSFNAAVLAAALALAGCGSSAVIPAGDATFNHATDRLERTAAEVEATGASTRERLLFMQAESTYRYRFTPPRPGAASVLASAAAAVTDFPVLQSLSGTLDVVDLRMRGADASVQLWESFAKRYPSSSLRPLALYRLGFAYRSAGATGLPRDSGDESLDELIRDSTVPQRLRDSAFEATKLRWKSKSSAATWSLVPGLGQFYIGDYTSGAARLAVALACAAAVIVPAVVAANRSSDLSWSKDWPLLASSIGGLIVLSFDYTSSYEAAMRGVVEWNERTEAAFEAQHPEAP